MLSLPPPPPAPPTPPLPPPPSRRLTTQAPLNQIVTSKQALDLQNPATTLPRAAIKPPVLRPPHHHQRTNPVIWCGAIFCLIFSLLLIFFGIATLIIFLVVRPRSPLFDAPNASLNSLYFDAPEAFNGDFIFLANFSNPNRKIAVRFESLDIELYFSDKLIGTQALQPFSQRPGEARLETVRVISSLVFLPQNLAGELRKQVQSNRVNYNIRGTFRVKAKLGLFHYSYWVHGRCQLQMTRPPTGVIVGRSCKTHKR